MELDWITPQRAFLLARRTGRKPNMKPPKKKQASNGIIKRRRSGTRDLTQVRFAEIARRFFESFPDAIVVIDRTGNIVQMNNQVESIFGYRRGELLDRPMNVLIPEWFGERHVKAVAERVADPHPHPMRVGWNC
jgi:PAS domain-containing protein